MIDCKDYADNSEESLCDMLIGCMLKQFMQSQDTNNRRSAAVFSAKWALIPCVVTLILAGAVMLTGEAVTVADSPSSPITHRVRSKSTDSVNHQQNQPKIPLFSGIKWNFPLRFWKKKTNSASNSSSTQAVSQRTLPAGHPDTGSSPLWLMDDPPEKLASLQSPPKSQPSQKREVRKAANYGEAPLPTNQLPVESSAIGLSGNLTRPLVSGISSYSDTQSLSATKQEETPYFAYSYDTRDWAEFYPAPSNIQPYHHESYAHENDAQAGMLPAVTKKTSLRTPIPNRIPSLTFEEYPTENARFQSTGQRDRQTITPTAYSSTFQPPVASQQTPKVFDGTAFDEARFDGVVSIDFSPSFKSRLPYTAVCGVVVVQANFPLTQAETILDEINRLQYDLNRFIGIPAPTEKIELCLFKDEASYLSFLQEFFPRAPRDHRALYIKLEGKPGTLLVQRSKNFEIDLRHEMTHAIIHATIPHVPIWLDEGLAKYFELPIADRRSSNPYLMRIRWSVRLGIVPSLARLTELETIDDMGVKEYQDSWAWTHFLIHRSPETHQLLASYLQMLSHQPSDRQAPSLKLYLDDLVQNQRETFKEHFSSIEKR